MIALTAPLPFIPQIHSQETETRQIETLNRSVLAIKTSNGVFINWRFLGTDPKNISFDVYRDGEKITDERIIDRTNFTDIYGDEKCKYSIRAYSGNQILETTKSVKVWEEQYLRVPLQRPASGVTPAYTVKNNGETESYPNGQEYTYSPNDCSVGDIDGDGEYELFVKWDPSNSRDNSHRGYTGNVFIDCYKMDGTFLWRVDLGQNIRAGAHYTQFMVYDFDGDGIAEMICRTAPGTIDGEGNPVLLGNDKVTDDYRTSEGLILSGSEYLTVFDGRSGAQIHSVTYNPARENYSWGDSYGNRENRFLAAVAYLDGKKPSMIACRGYYTRSCIVAYDFDGQELKQRWISDSRTSGQGAYGEGAHSLSIGDLDGDGNDEILYGSAAINHDGTILYRTGFGHGDALHLGDMNPDIDGLECFMVHEETKSPYGLELRAAGTGEVLFGKYTGTDVGRGMAADIAVEYRGYEFWSTASRDVYNQKGVAIGGSRPSVNFRVYWDGDLLDEILDGTKIDKFTTSKTTNLMSLNNYSNAQSCNSTKATPNLSADILGDWREEVIL